MSFQAKILIVDDDPDICAYMQTMLEASDYDVTTLSDPTIVVDRIKDEEFHLLVIDLMMPRMDGIELISQIRKVDTDVAIVVFTGYPSVDTAVNALKLNVSDYIQKPFEIDAFRQTIAEVLRRKGILFNPKRSCIAALVKSFGDCARKMPSLSSNWLGGTGLSPSLLSQIERAESVHPSVHFTRSPPVWGEDHRTLWRILAPDALRFPSVQTRIFPIPVLMRACIFSVDVTR